MTPNIRRPSRVRDWVPTTTMSARAARAARRISDVMRPAASVQEDDLARLAVLNVNSDLHPCGLGGGAKLQKIADALRRSSGERLAVWHGADDVHFCVVGACQGEGLHEGGPARLVNVHRADPRESCHELEPPLFDRRQSAGALTKSKEQSA